LSGTEKGSNEKEKRLSDAQIARLKGAIRFTNFGNFSLKDALTYINSGVLGHVTKKNTKKDEEPTPVTISIATFYRYKKEALDIEEIRREISEFMQKGYVTDLMTVRSVLQEVFAIMTQSLFKKDVTTRDKVFISVNLIRNMPLFTQYLEVLRVLHEKGKLPLGVKHEEPIPAKE